MKPANSKRERRSTVQAFCRNLDLKTAKALREFVAKALGLGIGLVVDVGEPSLMLKLAIGEKQFNLGTFKKDGTFRNYTIAWHTEKYGYPEIGEQYLEQLAGLPNGGYVDKTSSDRGHWTIRKRDNQSNKQNPRPFRISEILVFQDEWIQIARNTCKLIAAQER